MKTVTNHAPGPRGFNVKGGSTIWLDPKQEAKLAGEGTKEKPHVLHVGDAKHEITGALPDLGKPSEPDNDSADLAAAYVAENADLKAELGNVNKQVADLTKERDALKAENDKLKAK